MPKNLFEPVTRAGILQRLNALSAASTRQRGEDGRGADDGALLGGRAGSSGEGWGQS